MAYILEREMIPDLTASLPGLFGDGHEYAHACEVPDGSRVIDVVFAATPDPRQVLEGWQDYATGFKRLSSAQILVLAIVWKEWPITVAKLSSVTWTSKEAIRQKYIDPLIDLGLVQRSGRKSYEPTEWGEWEPRNVVTVEAKLADWCGALEQASDNRRRSDFSYVAFPADGLAHQREVRMKAKSKGVGVIEVNPDAGPTIVVDAKRVRRSRKPQRWVFCLRILIELLGMKGRWTLVGG